MSLFTDSISDAALTTAAQGGDIAFGKKVGGTLAGSVISGLGSIYNTAITIPNALGASIDEINTYETLRSYDDQWANYYKENQTAIDVAGFIAGSILPGGLAIKGLNAFRAGEATGAFARGLNFARTRQASALKEAMKELGEEGGTAFTRINKNKLAVMGWETADQVLQMAAAETAVALTMKQSPLLADDGLWDITKDIFTTSALFGGLTGGIMSYGINKGFKNAINIVDTTKNKYSALSGSAKLNLTDGDKAFDIINSVISLPKVFDPADTTATLKFHLGSGISEQQVDITKILQNTKDASVKKAMEEFQLAVRKIVNKTDAASPGANAEPETADALASFILKRYSTLKAANATVEQIQDSLGDVLFNLKKVQAVADGNIFRQQENLIYFKKSLSDHEIAGLKTLEDYEAVATSRTPFGPQKQHYQKPFIFLGTAEQKAAIVPALIGREGENGFRNLKEAWGSGRDIAVMPDGALRVNPKSPLWKQVDDPIYSPKRYLNTRTGAISDDAVLTAADLAAGGKKLLITIDGVSLPAADGVLKSVNMAKGFDPSRGLTYLTARHAWAAKAPLHAIPTTIDSRDISLLERLKTVPTKHEYSIKLPDGQTVSGGDVQKVLLQSKVQGIQNILAVGEMDIRELAYRFATTERWVEKLIETEFGATVKSADELLEGLSRPLEEFTQRENLLATYSTPRQFSALEGAGKMSWEEMREDILTQSLETGGQFVSGELAHAYRVTLASTATSNASGAALGIDRFSKLADLNRMAAREATSLGSGASLLGAANASYGEGLKLATQDIGKHVHQWIAEDSDAIASAFSTVAAKIEANPRAGAEIGIVTNILRNTDAKYVLDEAKPGKITGLVHRDIATANTEEARDLIIERLKADGYRPTIEFTTQEASDFFSIHTRLNGVRVEKQKVLSNARGFTSNKDPLVVYPPAIDTNYFQHFVFVRPVEGAAFSTSEVAMVFGRDAAELQQRVASIDRNLYDVITKDGSERYFKAKGQYDFDETINERTIDSGLRKSGALAQFQPEVRWKNIYSDYLMWHKNQASKLIRNAVESNYAQQIEELNSLGSSFIEEATSKFSGTLKASKSEIVNPYGDYVKTMLDISKRSEYTFFHQANEFVDALGVRAYRVLSDVTGRASKGLIPWEEANALMEKHGISGPLYSGTHDYFLANTPRDRNLIKEGVAKANTLLANLVLRFDVAQSLMNVISTPLLLSTELASIRTLVSRDDVLVGKLRELTEIAVPGGKDGTVPSTTKLLANAIRNFWGPDSVDLLKRYRDNGDIKSTLNLYHSAIADLNLSPDFKVFSDGVSRATEKVATLTGNNWSEEFTRFVSADVMRQLTEPLVQAGRMSLREANSYISVFVNRVQGNYISSQRPIIFQGVLGAAAGLFQTYSFNLLQQLFRHVENKDFKAMATLFGMQTGLFGLNGTPMFDAINTHIIGNAASNGGHYDAYSIAPGIFGKEWGDWLMYGTASAFPLFSDKWPALYSRGDINPRHMTILPINPLDIPAVDASLRTIRNLRNVGANLVGGADITTSLLQGLEHNGINRPLAGMAQLLAGASTTSKGALISASSDFNLITTAARIAGAKPMDEALALNNMYRLNSYVIADRDRMSALGAVVKTKLMNNQIPSDEEFFTFMTDYAKIGGRVENFNAALQRWMKDANVSVIEKIRANLGTTTGQRLNEIMGGEPLEDFRNSPDAEITP